MIDPIELHGLADGELAEEREAQVRRLLAESPESQAELQAILGVKSLLREKVSPLECRLEWKACLGRLDELDRTKKIERFVSGRFAWGLCGVFFVAILFAGYGQRSNRSPNEQSATLARMAASLTPGRSAETRGSKELNAALDAMLRQAKVWIDPNRMEIRSQAIGELDGRSVARVTLRDASGDMALFVVPDVLSLDGLGELPRDHSIRLGHIQDKNCVAWTDGRNTLVLVANRTYQDLAEAAQRLTPRPVQ